MCRYVIGLCVYDQISWLSIIVCMFYSDYMHEDFLSTKIFTHAVIMCWLGSDTEFLACKKLYAYRICFFRYAFWCTFIKSPSGSRTHESRKSYACTGKRESICVI